MEEKRNFTRIEFDAQSTFLYGDHQYTVRLLDLSLNGALISKPIDLQVRGNEAVSLNIVLSDGQTQVKMSGHIAHQEAGRLGIMCENIDVESASHLRRIVELNSANSQLLEREFEALIEIHNG